jgi:hypothetical protein
VVSCLAAPITLAAVVAMIGFYEWCAAHLANSAAACTASAFSSEFLVAKTLHDMNVFQPSLEDTAIYHTSS